MIMLRIETISRIELSSYSRTNQLEKLFEYKTYQNYCSALLYNDL